MRICVFGAGAIGGYVAAGLQSAGAEVSVVARGAHLDAIRRDGLTVHVAGRTLRAPVAASDRADEFGMQDHVVVCVKAPALPAVAAALAPVLAPETAVTFLMNGIPWWYFHRHGGLHEDRRLPEIDPDGTIWRTITPERAIGGIAWTAAEVIAPGVVNVSSHASRFALGEPDNSASPRVTALAEAMCAGGLETRVSPDIRTDIWRKLSGNVMAAPFAALTLARSRVFFSDPACASAIATLAAEIAAVGRAMGVTFEQDIAAHIAAGRQRDHLASLAQDLQQGRPMEIDALFTLPQRFAREAGLATPMLDLMTALVKLRAGVAGLYPAQEGAPA